MSEKLLIATGNRGKFNEISEVLHDLPYDLLSLADLKGDIEQVEETGETHEANARLKANQFYCHTGWMTLGEDSGLEVDALKNELGLHTRRWGAGHDASDEEWLNFFLKRMEMFPGQERTARFVCVAVLMTVDGKETVFEGEARGTITHEPQGPILPGLPLSSVFRPEGFDRVYAALSPVEKAQISHRGLVALKVKDFLIG